MTIDNWFHWVDRNKPCLFKTVIACTIFLGSIGRMNADQKEDAETNPADASRLEMKTERVIMFKDGYGLVVKKAKATTDAEGVVFTDEVPDAAVLGSFWVVPQKGTIKSTIAGWVDTTIQDTEEISCTNIVEVVKANLGKSCDFEVGEEKIEGKLLKILANDSPVEVSTNPLHEYAARISSFARVDAASNATTTRSSVSGDYFLVRTKTGDKMIAVNSVRNLTIENMNSSLEQTTTTKAEHKRLSMRFEVANQEVELNVMYFRPDFRWVPTYRVNLTDEAVAKKGATNDDKTNLRKMAKITMQGEILNEAEDLIDVPIHIVVGVPNFRFRSVPSPMVLESKMQNLLAQATPNSVGMNQFSNMSNGIFAQQRSDFSSNLATGDEDRVAVNLPSELSGSGGNDLFVYELPAMTLMKGERAMVPILQTEVPYRDIYTWDIELVHSETYAATSADSPSPLRLSESKVWRQVELVNNTDLPWTTGAAMFVDGIQPLAQELLTYTSPGGMCRVPVTVSVDLRGKVTDTESKRTYNSLNWRGNSYALVEGKIEVELANNKAHAVPVEVRLRFGGKATEASDKGTITLESFRQNDWVDQRGDTINNSSLIQWEATVEPGESFKPTANYEFLLRH